MALSYYASTRPGALSTAMNSSTTQVALVSAATFPDPAGPGNSEYTIIVGYGSDREEVCTVTAKSGDTLTVVRGQDSSAATAKNQGDIVVHGVSARDFKGFATDPRLTDARTPTAHATSHAPGGTDAIPGMGSFVICKRYTDYYVPSGPGGGKYAMPVEYAYSQRGADVTYSSGEILVSTAGTYLLGAAVVANTAFATLTASVRVYPSGGSPYLYLGGGMVVDIPYPTSASGSMPWQCSAGDRIALIVNQTGMTVTYPYTSLWAARLG